MTDLICSIQPEDETDQDKTHDDGKKECAEKETTSIDDIENFNRLAKQQASNDLSKLKKLTNVCDVGDLRSNIASLNFQQRRLYDDFTERVVSSDENERSVYLFVSGNAVTGKSFLVKLLLEAVKMIKIKAGDNFKKPPILVMAPTANAAFIIGGQNLGFYQLMATVTHKHILGKWQ